MNIEEKENWWNKEHFEDLIIRGLLGLYETKRYVRGKGQASAFEISISQL